MPFLTWGDSYSTKIEAIDDQHKQLFALVNRLFDSMLAGASNKAIRQVLAELIRYTMFHFAAEEAAMVKQYHTGRAKISRPLLDFLKNWLTVHILGSDYGFWQFLISRSSAK